MKLTHAVADPRCVAVIKESAGQIMMSEKKWTSAYNEFFEAFKSYQEAGNSAQAKLALKYVVLANMLTMSDINLFDASEARAFQDDPEIQGLHHLRVAFDNVDINAIEAVLNNPLYKIRDDCFVSDHLDQLMRGVRVQVLVRLTSAYRVISIDSLCEQLRVDRTTLYPLIVQMTHTHSIETVIDEVGGFIQFGKSSDGDEYSKKLTSIQSWISSLSESEQIIRTKAEIAVMNSIAPKHKAYHWRGADTGDTANLGGDQIMSQI
eukprot:GHVO01044202.1.p1 GENE.GHVO01044202.1~~GHVO01044202.1.p1  ORF type:complete len:263 (+),score=65.38 GHVO01044202.1:546-1334(+)